MAISKSLKQIIDKKNIEKSFINEIWKLEKGKKRNDKQEG